MSNVNIKYHFSYGSHHAVSCESGLRPIEKRKVKKNAIHSFREVQVKKNDLRSRSRSESEIKMTGNRDREVKVK